MARGRVISKSLGSSRRFHKLLEHAGDLGEFAQALYPLMVAHADDFGRLSCDAFTVKHEVFPTSPRTEEEFDRVLNAMHTSGLIVRYVLGAEQYAQIDKFEEHQSGLHKRTASKIPGPPENVPAIPSCSGIFPDIPSELKGTELNGREGSAARVPSTASHQPVMRIRERRETLVEPPIAHVDHVFCWRMCVPRQLHEDFVRRMGGDAVSADKALRAWYEREAKRWGEQEIGSDRYKFWNANYAEWRKSSAATSASVAAKHKVQTAKRETDVLLKSLRPVVGGQA
jgi:hypothetical protein